MPRPPERRRTPFKLAVLTLAGILVGSLVGMSAPAAPAQAAGSIFDGGMIISDAEFFDGSAMTAAEVQAFLNDKGRSCVPAAGGPACIKDFTADLPAMAADRYCRAVPAKPRATAAEIIAAAGQACGISQKVLLVMLQKEQGLVTRTKPTQRHFDAALGQSCPDTAPCDPRAAGFVNQIYLGARQQQLYVQNPGWYNYRPGRVNTIQWHPDRACGTSQVYIENQATANLYIYTPYRANIAALAAGTGTGDECSAYGNRNFYNYYQQWFKGAGGAAALIAPCTVPPATEIAARGDKLVVTASSLNARTAPTTKCGTGAMSLGKGTVVQASGTYGAWTRANVNGQQMWLSSQYLATAPALPYSVDRVQGADRVITAVEMSKRGFPDGAKVLFIASGADYPDALTASSAAAAQGASLLITGHAGLPAEAWQEARRLNPSRVVVLGGTSAVSETVVGDLRAALPGARVERVGGADRFETSRLVATQLMTASSTVYLATGLNYPDALSAAGAGAAREAAVLLVDGRSPTIDAATRTTLTRLSAKTVIIVGGEDVLPAGMVDSLRAAGLSVERLGGADRYVTNLMVSSHVYPGAFSNAFFATGQNFPDAVVGAVLSARKEGPLLLTPTNCMSGAAQDYLIKAGARQVTLLGGPEALSDAVFRSVRC
ncbi:cell wall-binding repeat-containing protein [Microbacterium sp. zg.Y625]|uniref:cell wall-binding repeat-containing protein n=1 Tax=Microbacterium jiangjiandongii TaxID=3049071 RepID=UPI00214ADA0E|nr:MULTISPECIES: cell wall-binding repeat-containing protein [unclassified Microbacterium]MCR2793737.1 cell wall-binding repeat-containing protein [Microbacterium sp. zg.Y625]WIM26082.1 cell wall-binding repeat-containing protein [Microbacterium sp. zg-Y625]